VATSTPTAESVPEPEPLPQVRILVADDDAVGRTMVSAQLRKQGHEVSDVADGDAAWKLLADENEPSLAILDWMMPGLSGIELCRRIREREDGASTYVIMLTSRDEKTDLLEALESGADDYITKPFDPGELRARVQVGLRVMGLQLRLRDRVVELEETLRRVQELQNLLPICAYCRQVRDDGDYWHDLEDYLSRHGEVRFSHGICPDCAEEHFG